jgi:hypothetical protein
MARTPDLSDLSALGLNPITLEAALEHPERARKVRLDSADKSLLKLRRVIKLDLGGVEPPPWLGELRHLRMIKGVRLTGAFPSALLALPRLAFVHFDNSKLESLDGVEKMPALCALTIVRTPVLDNAAALQAVVAKIPGAKVSGMGISVERKPGKAPGALAKAIQSDDVADWSDLQGSDLAGATFEDGYFTHDLTGANLANTTWKRCDFEYAKLTGADLTGATFEDCYFGSIYDGKGMLGGVKAAGVTFRRCGGTLQLEGANIENARFVALASDTSLKLDKVKGKGLELEASFCSEKEHRLSAKGADLRGARVRFDVTPDRREEIARKPTSRFAWKTTHLADAKTDKTTQIEYAPLGADKKKAKSIVDEKGRAARSLGALHASNASLWFLAIDAADAAAWRGSADNGDADQDGEDDFERALETESGPISVGKAKGVLAEIGDRGWSHVWEVEGGIALVDCSMQLDDKAAAERALALRVAQWAPKSVKKIGKVTVKSGVLALMLPYRDGRFSAKELEKAKTSVVGDKEHDRILVPLPNGTYDVVWHVLGPKPNYEDEVGRYQTCTRIVRAT